MFKVYIYNLKDQMYNVCTLKIKNETKNLRESK